MNNNCTEISDASGKVTSIDCTYEEFSGSVKKATNLKQQHNEHQKFRSKYRSLDFKTLVFPNDDVHEGGEIYTSKYETSCDCCI